MASSIKWALCRLIMPHTFSLGSPPISPANHQHPVVSSHLWEILAGLGNLCTFPLHPALDLPLLPGKIISPIAPLAPTHLAFLRDDTSAILPSLACVIHFPLSLTFYQV